MYEELTPSSAGVRHHQGHDDVTAEILKRDLESELKLGNDDIRSYAWNHGKLPRDVAEELLNDDGDFLVRESMSSPGEHVLSIRWRGPVLHFKVNEFVLESGVTAKKQFHFERDGFDSIPALVLFHYGRGFPVSEASGAVIRHPVNRGIPISYSDAKYSSSSLRRAASVRQQPVTSHRPAAARRASEEVTSPGVTSPLPNPFPLHLPRDDAIPEHRVTSDVTERARRFESAPSKPSRVASFRKPVIRHTHVASKSAGNTPVGNKDKRSFKGGSEPSTPMKVTSHPPVTMRKSVTSLMSGGQARSSANKDARKSIFTPLEFKSTLLPDDNKPVEGAAMRRVTELLLTTDPFKLARHMTLLDCELCKVHRNGLEELFLPIGAQLRKDVMERYQCVAFWVAVCIVRGGNTDSERVDILNVFIQVANESVHSLGNVFGFSALMHGLTCPQISQLSTLWRHLQQKYTNNYVTIERKLKPLFRFLDEGKGKINMTSTCLPHVMPLVRFFENSLPGIPHNTSRGNPLLDRKQISASEGDMLGSVASAGGASEWWQNLPDDSFDSLMSQLSIGREIVTSADVFRKNATTRLQDFTKSIPVYELFSTEFQLRLLWGYRGSEAPQGERYHKFDRVITLSAKKIA